LLARRTSTRVSSGFVLLEHSSPSFGSQHLRSLSTQRTNRIDGTILRLDRSPGSYLILRKQSLLLFRLWVYHPITRAHVRLLGSCYKTGEISGHHGHRRSFVVSRSSSKSNQVATTPASKNSHFDQPNDEISRVLTTTTRVSETFTPVSRYSSHRTIGSIFKVPFYRASLRSRCSSQKVHQPSAVSRPAARFNVGRPI